MASQLAANLVNHPLAPRRGCYSILEASEHLCGCLFVGGTQTFCHKSSKHLTGSDRADVLVLFYQRSKPGSREERLDARRSLRVLHVVDEASQRRKHSDRCHLRQRILKVLRAESKRSTGTSFTERADGVPHHSFRNRRRCWHNEHGGVPDAGRMLRLEAIPCVIVRRGEVFAGQGCHGARVLRVAGQVLAPRRTLLILER